VPPPVEPFQEPGLPVGPDLVAFGEQLAAILQRWAATSVIQEQPAELPPRLPRGVAAWLPGLTRDEVIKLMSAPRADVGLHLRSLEIIPGVRTVRPLEPVRWTTVAPSATDVASVIAPAPLAPS
jgi:hypothetical protein